MSSVFRKTAMGFLLLALAGQAGAAITVPPGGSLALPSGGALNLGCTDLNVQGNVAVGPGQINQAATVGIAATGVLDGGSGIINAGGNWNNSGVFIPGSGTVVFGDGCSAAPVQVTGNTTFNNLTLSSTGGRIFVIPAGYNITVNGALTLQGTPGLPIQLVSSSGQTAYIALGPNANVVSSNANVHPNVQIGAAPAQAIPALGEYGFIILTLLLAAVAARPGSFPLPHSRHRTRITPRGETRNEN